MVFVTCDFLFRSFSTSDYITNKRTKKIASTLCLYYIRVLPLPYSTFKKCSPKTLQTSQYTLKNLYRRMNRSF